MKPIVAMPALAPGRARARRHASAASPRLLCGWAPPQRGAARPGDAHPSVALPATNEEVLMNLFWFSAGKRLESVGVENTEENRRDWRQLLYTAPGETGGAAQPRTPPEPPQPPPPDRLAAPLAAAWAGREAPHCRFHPHPRVRDACMRAGPCLGAASTLASPLLPAAAASQRCELCPVLPCPGHCLQAWGSTSRAPSCLRRRCTRRGGTVRPGAAVSAPPAAVHAVLIASTASAWQDLPRRGLWASPRRPFAAGDPGTAPQGGNPSG